MVAAEAIDSGAALHAFSPSGGLHHAHRDRASGFCTYNDAAVACRWLKDRGHRVAYVDVDVHHGDGVEAIFQSDPDVLTISLHESGRWLFPGTGFPQDSGVGAGKGSAANMPFVPFTWDEPWLMAFDRVVPALLRRFKPTVLVTQDGCDTHHLDPLAHLAATTRIWPHVGRAFHELAHELCEGRWLALGGGGYAIYARALARHYGRHIPGQPRHTTRWGQARFSSFCSSLPVPASSPRSQATSRGGRSPANRSLLRS